MSQENVELVRSAMEAVARQDLTRLIELTDPEVEWHSFLAELGEGGVYHGHDRMRRYVRDLGEGDVFSCGRSENLSKPSLPLAARSKTFTPTPDPAGYCAGDVAGERRPF